jgi:hypothetical protein
MVKQSVLLMGKFLTHERMGTPQILAAMLLLAFLAQCAWLVAHETSAVVSAEEYSRVQEGIVQWRGKLIAGTPVGSIPAVDAVLRGDAYDPQHSPLWYLIEAAPLAATGVPENSRAWLWLSRAPYVLIGVLLGASLWYVSRRLYGNAGGYIALALYCFSPAVLRSSCLWFAAPNIAGTWGVFGAVFTAIAVSHTLYAPREVVLWNWRRILLLGISLALAIGSQFSLVIILPLLILFMLYLAPERKGAAVAILGAAIATAVFLLLASYFFHPALFWHGLANAHWLEINTSAFGMPGAHRQALQEIAAAGPVLVVLAPAALVVYAVWHRSRYFGNTAPLIFALLFLIVRIGFPHEPDSVFSLLSVTFLFVFVAGNAADLLETKAREWGTALGASLVAANAIWNLIGLAQLGR